MPGPGLPWLRPDWEPLPAVDPQRVRLLQAELKLPRALCSLLAVRGFVEPDDAKDFLRPRLDGLAPAELLADGDAAAERLAAAVRADEIIFLHGDYDVDGVSGVSLLTRWLRELGGTVVPFVPNRATDGYDLGPAGIRAATEAGAGLLVTIDCGIRAHEAVVGATEAGMDVVVTDHHTPAPQLPPALAVVNPNRSDCRHPNKGLCGAGVAWQLARLVGTRFGKGDEDLHGVLDLVALATVADLVPLQGENRTLVRYGLRVMAQSRNPGLRALMQVADVKGEVDAGQVGYRLGPRINAVGRMADAKTGVELLLTDDPNEARRLAGLLDDQNRERREEERRTLDAALAELEGRFDPERDFGVVLDGEDWHPGVIGIVASRVVERIHRPTVLVARNGETGRGSARSIPGFHLLEAIEACGDLLSRYGGHRQAAGMDVATERIGDFRERFNSEVRERLGGETPRPRLRADLEIGLDEADDELMRYLPYVGPFGIGNPGPVFVSRGVHPVGEAREVGTGHLKLILEQNGRRMEAIGFGLAERIPPESVGDGPLDVLYRLKVSEYRGRTSIEAHLRDVRPAGEAS